MELFRRDREHTYKQRECIPKITFHYLGEPETLKPVISFYLTEYTLRFNYKEQWNNAV
jgi:hypothetical protein